MFRILQIFGYGHLTITYQSLNLIIIPFNCYIKIFDNILIEKVKYIFFINLQQSV